jgi:hypothetical protein
MTYDKVLVNTIFIFIISTYILSKFLKSNRAETGEQFDLEMEGLFIISVFLLLCSFGITVVIMLILHWIEFLFVKNLKYFNNQFKLNQLC